MAGIIAKGPLARFGVWADMKSGRCVNEYRNGYQACLDSVKQMDRLRGAGDISQPLPIGSVGVFGADTLGWTSWDSDTARAITVQR